MASLKDVKQKIVGVGKTKQITKAMNMVSSSKLRGAQARIERFRPYADKFSEMLGTLSQKAEGLNHSLLDVHETKSKCLILLITSDRGLCGGFNANVITTAFKLAKEKTNDNMQVSFICVGKKGRDAVKKSTYELAASFPDALASFDFSLAAHLGKIVGDSYSKLESDEVIVISAKFVSLGRQIPTATIVLPIQSDSANVAESEMIYEPSAASILAEILPRYLNVLIYRELLETSASEHAARMTAMDNATRNCNDIINDLTLLYNKTRQAAITADLMDIVGGAEALR